MLKYRAVQCDFRWKRASRLKKLWVPHKLA